MKWDEGLLDTLLAQMEASVRQHLKEGEEATGEVLGYWMYCLLACKPGAKLQGGAR